MAGACPEGLLEELAIQTKLHIIAVKSNPENIDELRRNLDKTGLYGNRIVVHPGEPTTFGLPPLFCPVNSFSEKLDEANLDAIFCSASPLWRSCLVPYTTRAARRPCQVGKKG